jgi:acetyl-CoA acyltransferase
MMQKVCVAGVGQTAFGKFLDRGVRSLAEEALDRCLRDSGISAEMIQSIYFSNALSGIITGQETIRGQVALRHTGLMGTPIINVDNACASGSSAFRLAWLSVASGEVDVALAIGSEKLTHVDKAVTFSAYASGVDVEERDRLNADVPEGHSVFMDIYAEKACKFMRSSGATVDDFALVTVKSRLAGSLNPYAQFRSLTNVEEVLAGTLSMCSPIADGAAAVILVSEKIARGMARKPIHVRATELVSANPDGVEPLCASRAAGKAYSAAGLGPEDVHVAEVHDASAPAEIMLYEHLGFAPRTIRGEGF